MKQIVKSLVIASILLGTECAFAHCFNSTTYVGLDYHHAYMKAKETEATNKPYANDYPGLALYAGMQFHENAALEVGLFHSAKRKKTFQIENSTQNVLTKTTRPGAYMDFIGLLPIENNAQLFAFVGMALIKPSIDRYTTINATGASVNGLTGKIGTKKHAILRFGTGVNYMINDLLGLRTKLGLESSSRIIAKQNGTLVPNEIKPFKNSVTGSLGLFLKF